MVLKYKWQMILFFTSTLWALSIGIFYFCISRPSKFSSMGTPPFLHYVQVCKTDVNMSNMTLSSLFTWTSLFCIKFVNFLYVTWFTPNLTLILPQSHGLCCSNIKIFLTSKQLFFRIVLEGWFWFITTISTFYWLDQKGNSQDYKVL